MAQKDGATDGTENKSGDNEELDPKEQNEENKDDNTDGEGDKAGKPANAKTFTEEQVNKIVERRLKKERERFEREKDLTEVEKLKAQNAEMAKRLAERDALDTFEQFFSKKGVKNIKGLYRALKDDLEFDDKGKVSNLKDLLDEAKETFPEFFLKADGDADGAKGKESKGQTKSFSDVIRRGFGRG